MAAKSAEHTAVLPFSSGEVLDDRWRLETRIGSGAMGLVYKGTDLTQSRPCAIKLLAPEHVRKPKVLARFEREAELMMSLRHPNIVKIYAHGRKGVHPWIAMEFLEGKTLSEVLEARGQALPVPETVAIVKRIAAGLSFLHHHDLVHRDIKPQNVFLVLGGRVTILDLGVVRDNANPGLTRPGAMVGTPYYMSPEQIQGLEDIDRRTDVYALAVMTFELLTGRPPFLGANNFEVLYGHRNTAVPDASTLTKSVSKALAQVLIRGMSKRREDRPDTASELAADLEASTGSVKVDLGEALGKYLETKPRARAAGKPRAEAAGKGDERAAASGASEKTRIVARPALSASAPTRDEVPLAENEDVISVADAKLPDEEETAATELPSESLPSERTVVGPAPFEPETAAMTAAPSEPSLSAVPTAGRLTVIATSQGKSVSGELFVEKKPYGQTPRTVTLLPGRYLLRVEAKGYVPAQKRVEVGGGAVTVKIELSKSA